MVESELLNEGELMYGDNLLDLDNQKCADPDYRISCRLRAVNNGPRFCMSVAVTAASWRARCEHRRRCCDDCDLTRSSSSAWSGVSAVCRILATWTQLVASVLAGKSGYQAAEGMGEAGGQCGEAREEQEHTYARGKRGDGDQGSPSDGGQGYG